MSWFLVAVAAVLIALNAFFVIAEYSLVRARHSRLELASEQGLRGAKLALRQLENINEYISTCQVGNMMVMTVSVDAAGRGKPGWRH